MSRPSSKAVSGQPAPNNGEKGDTNAKTIFSFLGGMVTGVLLTLAAASMIPEEFETQGVRR